MSRTNYQGQDQYQQQHQDQHGSPKPTDETNELLDEPSDEEFLYELRWLLKNYDFLIDQTGQYLIQRTGAEDRQQLSDKLNLLIKLRPTFRPPSTNHQPFISPSQQLDDGSADLARLLSDNISFLNRLAPQPTVHDSSIN